MALLKNGALDAVDGHMIGVKRCKEFPSEPASFFGPGSGVRSRRSSSRSVGRVVGRHRLVNPAPLTRTIDRQPDIYKRHPRPANMCTRLLRYIFGSSSSSQ
jgi:hypothetical protein